LLGALLRALSTAVRLRALGVLRQGCGRVNPVVEVILSCRVNLYEILVDHRELFIDDEDRAGVLVLCGDLFAEVGEVVEVVNTEVLLLVVALLALEFVFLVLRLLLAHFGNVVLVYEGQLLGHHLRLGQVVLKRVRHLAFIFFFFFFH